MDNKYIFTIIYILFVEFIWIYIINSNKYIKLTENIQKKQFKINYLYTIIAYVFVLASIFLISIPFAKSKIQNINKKEIIYKSLLYGGMVGFFIYGIYNLTSLSIYSDYDLIIGIMDTLWGTFLYASSTALFLTI